MPGQAANQRPCTAADQSAAKHAAVHSHIQQAQAPSQSRPVFYASVFDQQQTTHDQFTHMNRLEIAVGGGRKIPKNRG
jgi:hypothetical protein